MSMRMVLFLILCGVKLCASFNSGNTINPFTTALFSGNIPLLSQLTSSRTAKTDPRIYTTTVDIIKQHGYPVESHTVVTEDGYVLAVFRIPGSPKSPPSTRKTPVLVMHGLYACSDIWVVLGPKKSLGFLLADEGYDVWLGNVRGNVYSRKHLSLSPDRDVQFWNYTFHENGFYDLPAMIDHILNVTGQEQIMYIGHSMGCTMFLVMGSTRPEYNRKIRLMVALAPAVHLRRPKSTLFKLGMKYFREIYAVIVGAGVQEVLLRNKPLQQLLSEFCREGNPNFQLCVSIHLLLFGGTMKTFDSPMAPIILTHFFSGASINTFAHFVEIFLTDRFQWFDPTLSLTKAMPAYDLSQVSSPVALYCGDIDSQAPCEDVLRLSRELGNAIGFVEVEMKGTSHLDFAIGTQAKKYIYEKAFTLMKKY